MHYYLLVRAKSYALSAQCARSGFGQSDRNNVTFTHPGPTSVGCAPVASAISTSAGRNRQYVSDMPAAAQKTTSFVTMYGAAYSLEPPRRSYSPSLLSASRSSPATSEWAESGSKYLSASGFCSIRFQGLMVRLTGERPASLFRPSLRRQGRLSGAVDCYTAVTNLARRARRLAYRQYPPSECLLTKQRS